MLIIGAKGFAKEVLEILYQTESSKNIHFYDDVSTDIGTSLYDKFPVLKSPEDAETYFKSEDNRFTLGVGNPIVRSLLCTKFESIGGVLTTTISPSAVIGNFGTHIGNGCNIMHNAVLTNDVVVEKGVIINQLASIGHDVKLENFVEICPGVCISGNCIIGEFSFVGTNATILPKVHIGKNVIIGAGSVVNKDLPDNCTAVGVPAKIINQR